MIKIDGKDYYTLCDLHKVLMWVQKHGITIQQIIGEIKDGL